MTDIATRPSRFPFRALLIALPIILLALGGAWWWQNREVSLPPEDIAMVNGVAIRRSDFLDELRALHPSGNRPATPAERQQVLENLIREELIVQHGLALDLPAKDEDVRDALVDATRGHIGAEALAGAVSEKDLQDWYHAHAGQYATEGEITARDYIVPEARAAALKAALAQGASAQSLGLSPTGRVDGTSEFWFAARIHLGDALFAAARDLRAGQVSAPVRLADGVHLVQVIANDPSRPLPFAEVRARLLKDIQEARRDDALRRIEERLRAKAKVVVAPDA
jgi:parvulin-like peptidyl-prolyl isomerase